MSMCRGKGVVGIWEEREGKMKQKIFPYELQNEWMDL